MFNFLSLCMFRSLYSVYCLCVNVCCTAVLCVLFVCECVLYCCHRVSTELRLNIQGVRARGIQKYMHMF
jgi:hypothetical protein